MLDGITTEIISLGLGMLAGVLIKHVQREVKEDIDWALLIHEHNALKERLGVAEANQRAGWREDMKFKQAFMEIRMILKNEGYELEEIVWGPDSEIVSNE
jgi:hypothetical protein